MLLSSQIHGAWLRLAVVGRLLFQVFSLTCLSHIITALRKACAFVCIAGGFVRTLGIGLFEKDSSRRVKYRSRTMSIAYLIRAPVAGFIGLLLLVLLRGIRLLRQETSIRARLICLLQVFCFLGFTSWTSSSSFSSSSCLDRRLRLL